MLTWYYASRTESLLEQTADALFGHAASELRLTFHQTYRPIQELTSILSRSPMTSDTSEAARQHNIDVFTAALQRQPEAVGIQIGYPNGDYFIVRAIRSSDHHQTFNAPGDTRYVVDWVDYGSDGSRLRRAFLAGGLDVIDERDLGTIDYDPRTRPWYQVAMASDEVEVTEPYAFFFFRQPGMTVARRTQDGRAVVATDITLEALSGTLADLAISPNAHTLLYLPNGTAVAYQDASRLVITTPDNRSRIARVDELNIPILLRLEDGTQATPEGWLEKTMVVRFTEQLQPRLTVAAPREEILGDAYLVWRQALLVAVVIIVLALPLTWLIARQVSQPIRSLQAAVARVSRGDFDFQIPPSRRRDEVGVLTRAFDQMRVSLQDHMARLQATTAAKERLESELTIARDIQMSMVPGEGDLNRGYGNWQVSARLQPARAVGGDLFDVAEQADGKLLIVVGDVSDKGVPAALFMARTVSLLKLLYAQGHGLGELMAELNQHLCRDNDNCMFVTLLCAILDRDTGELELASAGHNPPVVLGPTGATPLNGDSGPPMGLYENQEFPTFGACLNDGEGLVLYTDGVTEAFNGQQEEFGEGRLLDALRAMTGTDLHSDTNPDSETTVTGILDAVHRFSEGEPQSDDITLLVLQRSSQSSGEWPDDQAPEAGDHYRLTDACQQPQVLAWLDGRLAGVGEDAISDLKVVVDELVANLFSHGAAAGGDTVLDLWLTVLPDRVALRLADNGPAFNPLTMDVETDFDSIDERPIGRLGLLLVRELTDEQSYRREAGHNILELVRRLPDNAGDHMIDSSHNKGE